MILDLHTHRTAPYPEGIISTSPELLPSEPGVQLYSAGFHPWDIDTGGLTPAQTALLEEAAKRNDVVAIGECGIDMGRADAAPLAIQMIVLREHIRVSEAVGKPLILHCVKAHDVIIGMKKELKPAQRWVIHGFRGKPSILKMLLDAGISVSYGEKFNKESVAATPPEHLFAETDESPLAIECIIATLQSMNPVITPGLIESNLHTLLEGVG